MLTNVIIYVRAFNFRWVAAKKVKYASSRTPSALVLRHPARAPWALCVVLGIFAHFPCGRTRLLWETTKSTFWSEKMNACNVVCSLARCWDSISARIFFENLVKLISEIARKAHPKRFKYAKGDLQGHPRRSNLPLRRNLFSLHEFEKYAYCLLENKITIYGGNWTIRKAVASE